MYDKKFIQDSFEGYSSNYKDFHLLVLRKTVIGMDDLLAKQVISHERARLQVQSDVKLVL